MNSIAIYFLQLIITCGVTYVVVLYMRTHLWKILVDLCGTSDRAQFWVVFSSILLIGLPFLIGVGYNPLKDDTGMQFFAVARQLRNNLLGFFVALISIGATISFFSLVAPRPSAK